MVDAKSATILRSRHIKCGHSINQTGFTSVLVFEICFKQKLDFVAIQEHRWNATEDVSEYSNNRYQFLYNGARERRQGAGIFGTNKLVRCITKREKVSNRILSITLNCNPRVAVVAVYAPTTQFCSRAQQSFSCACQSQRVSTIV